MFLSQFDSDEYDLTRSDISACRCFRIDLFVGYLHYKHSDKNDPGLVKPFNPMPERYFKRNLLNNFFAIFALKIIIMFYKLFLYF